MALAASFAGSFAITRKIRSFAKCSTRWAAHILARRLASGPSCLLAFLQRTRLTKRLWKEVFARRWGHGAAGGERGHEQSRSASPNQGTKLA